MAYQIKFLPSALKEWKKLDRSVQDVFAKKIERRIDDPHVPNARLSGALHGCYKIKSNKTGHRLVYRVLDDEIVIVIIAVGPRAAGEVYETARRRS